MVRTNRRDFLKTTGALAAGVWVSGTPAQERPTPNNRLNIAVVGCGGRGGDDLGAVAGTENIVALCDADERRGGGAFQRHPMATRYSDFRQMFDRQRNIDAVVVATPDHSHFLPTMMALRAGKHVYCEKPLTHSVWEARQVKEEAARHRNLATSMGNQGTAGNGLRTGVEVIRSGAIGDVRELHVWTNRPIWPQGMTRRPAGEAVPTGLNWDVWLGPAPQREYNHAYLPFTWRGWWDFGTGAIGDMACHTMNLPFMALRLGAPTRVTATPRTPVNDIAPPEGCTVVYEFPARDPMPACRMTWYERGTPPAALFQGERPAGSGSLIIGSRGTMVSSDDYGQNWKLLPIANYRDFHNPAPTLPRSPGHHAEWLRACKGGAAPMANFADYACQLTETALLGNVAMRVGRPINWDSANLRATGLPAADRFIHNEYRHGWTL
jgi:predicted dehydrogenase